jgi:hypothetical protein
MIKTPFLLVVLALAPACGKDEGKDGGKAAGGGAAATPEGKTAEELAIEKENAAPVPPKKPAAPRSENEVDLTFSGAFSATLKGKAGMCSLRKSGPIPGATWQVRSEELGASAPTFDFTIIAEPDKFQDPTAIVNTKGDRRASYGRARGANDAKLVLAEDATSAEVDLVLKQVAGKGELKVVGTIKCSQPDVFE